MVQAWTGAHLDPFLRKVSILGVTLHLRKFHEIVQVKTADCRTRETATANYKIYLRKSKENKYCVTILN